MKRKVLAIVLLVLPIVLAYSNVGGASGYNVRIDKARTTYVVLVRDAPCPTACNDRGDGYCVWLAHAPTRSACLRTLVGRWIANMLPGEYRKRLEMWFPLLDSQVGDTACIFWCCQPVPWQMYFGWRFATVTY